MTAPNQELLNAFAKFRARDFAGALAAIDAILVRQPLEAEALHMRALTLSEMGRAEEAIPAYERAIAVHPQKQAVLSNLGNALSRAGRIEAAIDAYRRALAIDPRFADAWRNLSVALKKRGDLADALEAATRSAELQPGKAPGFTTLGALLISAGRLEDAERALSTALANEPNHVAALLHRGRVRRDLGRHEGALEDLEKAVALAPARADAHHQLGNARRAAGQVEAAAGALQKALELSPLAVDLHRDYANCLWEAGRKGAFLDALRNAIARQPTADLINLYAELQMLTGDVASAEAATKRLIEAFPEHASGYALLSRFRRHERRIDEAIALARKAHDLAPHDFRLRHDYAETLLAAARFDEAAALLANAAPREHLQRHIALKSLAARGRGDPSYRRDYDYDRFAAKIFIETPRGYSSLKEFNAALLEAIRPLHADKRERPIEQTLYGGTQSAGRLWNHPHPDIQALKEALLAAARRYVDALPDDPSHPFLAQKTSDLACAGAWSVMLSSGGGHVDHIHPKGWISASYYVRIPPEIGPAEKAGHLRLGGSGVDGLNLAAERWIMPEEGAAIIFPSYMWHGVEPFHATSPRVTAPFDLAPR